jgi:hypothetical protein
MQLRGMAAIQTLDRIEIEAEGEAAVTGQPGERQLDGIIAEAEVLTVIESQKFAAARGGVDGQRAR